MSLSENINKWMFECQDTGASSKFMAATALGLKDRLGVCYPLDPSDFNRCLILIDWVPEIKDHFDTIAKTSPVWDALIERWDELEAMLTEEVGHRWANYDARASKTYDLMKEIKREARHG
jgi:hypothetical protein